METETTRRAVVRGLRTYFEGAKMTDEQVEAIIDALAPFGPDHAHAAIRTHYQKDDHHGHPKAHRLRELADTIANPVARACGSSAFKPCSPVPDDELERQRLAKEWVDGMSADDRERWKNRVIACIDPGWLHARFTASDPLKSLTLRMAMVRLAQRSDNEALPEGLRGGK